MKFKMKFLTVTILLSCFFISCNSDEDGDRIEADPNKELFGKWELTELRMTEAQDLNYDGAYSTNIVDELSCFFSEHTLNPDFTYSSESMGFTLHDLTDTEVEISCTTESLISGTWERVSTSVVKLGDSDFILEGNKLISEREVEFPEFTKVVYTKVN